jgi:hypothetical protein
MPVRNVILKPTYEAKDLPRNVGAGRRETRIGERGTLVP